MGLFDFFRKKDPKEAFGERVLRAIRKSGEQRPLRWDKEGFKIHVGSDNVLYLNNAFNEFMGADPDRQQEVIDRYSRLQLEPEIAKTLDGALAHLIPRVRERFYYESLRLLSELESRKFPAFAYQPLTEHFVVELAYDLPEQSMLVSQSQLRDWGTTLEDGLQRSMDLLRANTPRPMKPLRPGLYASSWGDSYAPSRILLPEFIGAHAVDGEPVAAIPNRDLLLLAGSRDSEALEEMARRIHQAASQPRFMTGQAMIFSEGSWSPFLPDEDHPAFTDFHRLHEQSMAGFYAEQKDMMNSVHQKKGIDIFVASFDVLRHKVTQRTRSFCVWGQGVDTLLPQTDEVMLLQTDDSGQPDPKVPAAVVPWAELRSRFSALMEPVDCYPARWRVRGFPRPEELAEFRKSP